MKSILTEVGAYGLHLQKGPTGRWYFVGSVPVELSNGRNIYGDLTFPTFPTRESAEMYVEEKSN